MTKRAGFLFTAFEPSGDILAASVIAQLKKADPDVPIWALAGPHCQRAGAELIEQTTQHAAMLFDSLKQAPAHWQRLRRIAKWIKANPLVALVPTDSPAANWSICKLVRRYQRQARIVHLVAPQLWAWGPWRINKLRRLSDHVLCLLPFEPAWFEQRGVQATFVGHPLFTGATPPPAAHRGNDTPTRLALLPGSRNGEIQRNWPTMRSAFEQLQRRHPGLTGRVAALDERAAALIHQVDRQTRGSDALPESMQVISGQTPAILDWCDLALVVSGTATLQIATHQKPMVVLYNISGLSRMMYASVGRWVLTTQTFALPNLIAEWQGQGRVVPEFAPHNGAVEPVAAAVEQLLLDPEARRRQLQALAQVVKAFAARDFSHAGESILAVTARNP
jgi:lipid-A-disaccharide synthase